ncbi:sigma-70 family RNA polymerase sigma factor [Candidatus Peregrinibacteria bacterium]|nr:sigma-70 family RNA polymerase sigma factor [Candidatus Peregrinibacteria bacterium]
MDIKDLTDSELLEKISQKDYNAFDELWRRYDRFIISLFQSLLRDKHLAEDSYQQLFMRIWQNSHNYRGGDVESYLHGMTRNIYKETVRKNTRELPMSSFSEDRQEEILSEFATYQSTDWMSNNGQLMEDIETKIQKFIDTLPEQQREIFNLRINNELSWKDISEKVRINKYTCSTIYRRLNARIKAMLEKYGLE